ncbi:uncharacterized protein ARMOST_16963 [Armillaria ostoyae]|uniref:Uncharacterized protein n=1 Tax=Armillaria ostoyae TaxID=47428 RepID=A0A284RXQ3_ARMOS|nr:uncharacterized protein ARMOST_16963 [Armillaria ostoyae]
MAHRKSTICQCCPQTIQQRQI